jgi:hypothetical protein
VLRLLLWRLLGLLAVLAGLALTAWFLRGGPGRALRGSVAAGGLAGAGTALGWAARQGHVALSAGTAAAGCASRALIVLLAVVVLARWRARRGRS